MDILHHLKSHVSAQIVENKDLSHYLTLKTETRAQYYLEATNRDELIGAVRVSTELGLPFHLIGGGSNIAVTRSLITGLVVRNRYLNQAVVQDTPEYVDIMYSSGYPMSRVVKETTEAGYEGFQHHMGLPGTVGGAIYMNSKWTKPVSYCGDNLISATLVTPTGEIKEVDRAYFSFAYDYSNLQKTQEILLEAIFRLGKHHPDILKAHAQTALAYRKKTQPQGIATGGCFFQNISEKDQQRIGVPTKSAGYLIDKAGLKGKKVGSYVVSEKHANFIINEGLGKAEDLFTLVEIIKSTVKEQFDVQLHEEVVIK